MSLLAVTGGTGFVGGATLTKARRAGHKIRALTRQAQAPCEGLDWVPGTLSDDAALERLVRGVDAVIHIAGVVNAPDRAGFEAGNSLGTAALIRAMQRAGVRRLIHVSSLAVREPALSNYGWSKAEAERHVMASDLGWTMVRPPAIYGPGDAELLELFQMAARGFVLLPPKGRLSIIHVDDLADLLVRFAGDGAEATLSATYEVDDGLAGGWSHAGLARAIGTAVGRTSILPLSMPAPLVKLGARIDRLMRGDKARLTPDRAAYFCHPDWVSRPDMAPPATLWQAATATPDGLAATAAAYRTRGLL